ncbi:LysR family transcriptional regulator [Aureimonas fodinaquatilis]|uniref:LysR family transcriptional regulator n=1 Tax=Aureimonas fodinaquatilis TaxID=2565783 RepID=A0A5B0DZ97_9HYPH|nr:LysR family transcriptional regulator [Aureimonas fodinaquatilis]KAA0970870.1 LysR family transcriptional regulator [Aureimonas fodinaquatilis]
MQRISLRIYFDDKALGPGKVELLEGISKYGSIAAAGRAMGMSYKRAWLLVAETDELFGKPTVEKQHGGKQGGGARLSKLGETIVREYRIAQQLTENAVALPMSRIQNEAK